jgi:NitT/TauT family transport system substrate-binding protein
LANTPDRGRGPHHRHPQRNARQLMTSYDVLGGAHSLSAFWATESWVKANPKTYQAVLAAFEEATELIAKDREAAARTYSKWEASTLPTADVARIIGTPSEITFTATPNRTLMIAETMHKVGLLKTKPAAWTDYFMRGCMARTDRRWPILVV